MHGGEPKDHEISARNDTNLWFFHTFRAPCHVGRSALGTCKNNSFQRSSAHLSDFPYQGRATEASAVDRCSGSSSAFVKAWTVSMHFAR